MKINKYPILIGLLIFAVGLTTIGCSNTDTTDTTDQNISTEETTQDEHNLDIQADDLSSNDLILSLEGYGAVGALADKDLTIADMLMYAAQDEYLAHGEYEAIIQEFGNNNPYANIVKSEETHLSYLEEIYTANNMAFPKDESAEQLIIPTSLLEAAQTGVQAEIDNIKMYDLFLSYDLPSNIKTVFEELKNGSESHLAAFQKQVDKLS
ncbi:MAG: DUF2202 domain-containing protein [Firmicutes bacterium]|nr:DUF2202 domain-containing protein [Bacillota bacterium]